MINIRAAIAMWIGLSVALAGSHLLAYQSGKKQGVEKERNQWIAKELSRAEVSAKETERIRSNENLMRLNNERSNETRISRDVNREKLNADLRAELDRLRDELNTIRADSDTASANTQTCPGTYEAATFRELFEQSATRYSEVAGTAQQLSDQVAGLQDYIKGVCQREQ